METEPGNESNNGSSDEHRWDRLRGQLEQGHSFPCSYVFKFIVSRPRAAEWTGLLDHANTVSRASRYGNYVAVTLEREVACAEEVVMIYQKAAAVPGIMAL